VVLAVKCLRIISVQTVIKAASVQDAFTHIIIVPTERQCKLVGTVRTVDPESIISKVRFECKARFFGEFIGQGALDLRATAFEIKIAGCIQVSVQ